MTDIRRDLTRTTLAILCILGLIGLSLWVLRPFLAATVWATMIVVATWPLLLSLEARFGQRRAPAVAVMSLAMLLLLVLPLLLAIDTIADHSGQLTEAARNVAANGLPLPPDWVASLPLLGEKLAMLWTQLAASGAAGILAKVTPYAADTGKWVLAQVGGLGGMLIQFLLVVTIAAILYSGGEVGARMAQRFGRRLAGERGENSIILAGQAIRGVALGVGVTAIVQTVLGGIGLAIAGVPFASLLSAVMLMLCIAQVGPSLILFPAVGWMYWMGDNGWATFLLIWSVVVATLDNFLRPMLIKRGADLPLLLIFAGVIGGMLSFGLIGIFVGPVVLAVTYTLMLAWIEDALGKDEEPVAEPVLEAAQADHPEPPAG
ncbi:AI-2E family transporter YdiK [Dechloromonas sp. A34]|uniref:AI-2E family transporter YdiK n=1 Tax=Dechloromonas sp. A34 TaxID=447588 RepID=UPI0022495189|nr:AI-2E family transporter YdiK [Dechloromonas sp. A34]